METNRFGAWSSPLSADSVARQAVRLGMVRLGLGGIVWSESRPEEGGRTAICHKPFGSHASDLIPVPFSARCRINTYGGGEFLVQGGDVIFTNDADQSLYRVRAGWEPQRLAGEEGVSLGDCCCDEVHGRLFCIAEQEVTSGWPIACLMRVDLDDGQMREVARGRDFYTTPRVSPDGVHLAWLAWDLPYMPWEAAELWVADIDRKGDLVDPRRIAGGRIIGSKGYGVFQPEWSTSGDLFFVWDKTGWGNLYCWREGEACRPLCEAQAEYGQPQWMLGMSSFAVLDGERLAVRPFRRGVESLAVLDLTTSKEKTIETTFQSFNSLGAEGNSIVAIVGGAATTSCIALFDAEVASYDIIHDPIGDAGGATFLPEEFQKPQFISFPTTDNAEAYGLYYEPRHLAASPPPISSSLSGSPPLIVSCHGGPTAMANRALNLKVQFWTSRGFAWLDVDYRGSFGYGRAYREALNGHWGEVDVQDAMAGARFLADSGKVEPSELFITGGSAGGYTVLSALVACDLFRAGAVYYGIGDLERLQAMTHKFEAGYVSTLAGTVWQNGGEITPTGEDILRSKSPRYYADKISAPVIFFQGCDDTIVPPEQSRYMVDTLSSRNIPVACMMFEGEGHGFRGATAIRQALAGHYAFYTRVLGVLGAQHLQSLNIVNEEAL
ncbi:MAG: prolyl oligopeptidase family serine peptidase [Parvularculales bacterium]